MSISTALRTRSSPCFLKRHCGFTSRCLFPVLPCNRRLPDPLSEAPQPL
nr:MAG TPA: hypothetical protein [Caudoviricetes sp.]